MESHYPYFKFSILSISVPTRVTGSFPQQLKHKTNKQQQQKSQSNPETSPVKSTLFFVSALQGILSQD